MAQIISYQGITPRIDPTVFLAPTAVVIGNVEIGPDSSIWFGAVLRGDNPDQVIRVGARSSIQDNCVLHVSDRGPTIVGDDVTVGHGAVFESCRIERGALIGMNAVLLHEVVIGAESIVGASSLVPERMQVPPRTLVAGVPARVRKELTEEMLQALAGSSRHYVQLKDSYMREWIGIRG